MTLTNWLYTSHLAFWLLPRFFREPQTITGCNAEVVIYTQTHVFVNKPTNKIQQFHSPKLKHERLGGFFTTQQLCYFSHNYIKMLHKPPISQTYQKVLMSWSSVDEAQQLQLPVSLPPCYFCWWRWHFNMGDCFGTKSYNLAGTNSYLGLTTLTWIKSSRPYI